MNNKEHNKTCCEHKTSSVNYQKLKFRFTYCEEGLVKIKEP